MNEFDTNVYANTLRRFGFQNTEDIYNADLILLNTCAVRDKTIKKAVSFLGIAAKIKKAKPELIVALTGCASTLILKELKSRSYIDFVWGALNYTETPDKFQDLLIKNGFTEKQIIQNPVSTNFSRSIPIIFGCDSFCSYCIVPYLRGREKSIPQTELLKNLEQAVKDGSKEIVLLGQNVNHYGFDLEPTMSFADLLQIMAKKYPSVRFDFLTSHPKDFDIKILQIMQTCPNIYRHFHLPAQHGDNTILKNMNRGYTRENYMHLIETIRRYFPMATLSTDLIVGFPGETEAAFLQTLNLMEQVEFDMIFAAQYSKRPGTTAETLPDQLPEEVKRERINILLNRQKSISKRVNSRWIDHHGSVIVTGITQKKEYIGKTEEEKSVIIRSENLTIGTELNVFITKYENGTLFADILRE